LPLAVRFPSKVFQWRLSQFRDSAILSEQSLNSNLAVSS
jgi:hypothetical protein